VVLAYRVAEVYQSIGLWVYRLRYRLGLGLLVGARLPERHAPRVHEGVDDVGACAATRVAPGVALATSVARRRLSGGRYCIAALSGRREEVYRSIDLSVYRFSSFTRFPQEYKFPSPSPSDLVKRLLLHTWRDPCTTLTVPRGAPPGVSVQVAKPANMHQGRACRCTVC
jgi:hypothetical protein